MSRWAGNLGRGDVPRPDDIDFIADWSAEEPFADVAATQSVADPARMLRAWSESAAFEAAVYGANTVHAALLERLSRYRRAVARITVPGPAIDHAGQRRPAGWNGTGFLVGHRLLITNHHVINSTDVAASARVEFDYEWPVEALNESKAPLDPPTRTLTLAPDRLFLTSKAIGGLDFTFVWLDGPVEQDLGTVPMERGAFAIAPYEPTFIIHHPNGRLKQVSLDDTELLGTNATALLYAADTEYGSSGGCVFDSRARLVALHHARRVGSDLDARFPTALKQLQDGRPVRVANEGIKISAIAVALENRASGPGPDALMARAVLDQMRGTDTLAGTFGAAGRVVTANTEAEEVRAAYAATDQDLDICFWDVGWMGSAVPGPDKVRDIAIAMTDLNPDVWILTHATRQVANIMGNALSAPFGQSFTSHYAPESGIAVISRDASVICAVRSADSRGPTVYRLSSVGDGGAVNVVPFSREPGLYLPVILSQLSRICPNEDVLMGGGAGAPVRSALDLPLEMAGYSVMPLDLASTTGAVSYLRTPLSPFGRLICSYQYRVLPVSPIQLDFERNIDLTRYFQIHPSAPPAAIRLIAGAIDAKAPCARGRDFRPAVPGLIPASRESASWSDGLQAEHLTKVAFFTANRHRFHLLIRQTNDWLGRTTPDNVPLNEADLCVVLFCEAAIQRSSGHVDPEGTHSAGERGLLPLPNNISYWIGLDAPAWNRPMPLHVNLKSYARYLAQLKNKAVRPVGNLLYYRDLFRLRGFEDHPLRSAKLLAGIVHGYFVAANYPDAPVPHSRIIQGYLDDLAISEIHAGSGYVYEAHPLLAGRQANVEAALSVLR